jgi:hypothetical protein
MILVQCKSNAPISVARFELHFVLLPLRFVEALPENKNKIHDRFWTFQSSERI